MTELSGKAAIVTGSSQGIGRGIAVACDVRKMEDVEACVAKAMESFGGIDILVNNAQTIRYVFISEATDETMQETLHSGPLAVPFNLPLTGAETAVR